MSINQRVRKIYEELLKKGKVSGVIDFAYKMGYTQSQISNVFNDKRNAGPKLISAIVSTYSVSDSYLNNGKGEIFKTDLKNNYDNNSSVPDQVAEGISEYRKKSPAMEKLIEAFKTAMDFANRNNEELWQANREQRDMISRLVENKSKARSA